LALEYPDLSGINSCGADHQSKLTVTSSSARDQLAHRTVAVKKLAEPFKTPAIARHMFREMKLLRQLRHENIINLTDIFISPSEDMYEDIPLSLQGKH
jgi:serine/threonine protein kinase